jgi:hypothetical protein
MRTQLQTLLLMKTKVIKRKFEDQEDTRTTQDEDAAADAAANAVIPDTTLPHWGAEAACPQPLGHGRCKRVAGGGRKNARS